MGKKKDNTVWKNRPETQEIKDLKSFEFKKDPRLPYIFGNRKREFAESYNNPLGAYTTPHVRDSAVRARNDELDQEYMAASQGENAMANNAKMGQLTSIAQMMQPELVKKTGGMDWGALLGAGAQVGSAALM